MSCGAWRNIDFYSVGNRFEFGPVLKNPVSLFVTSANLFKSIQGQNLKDVTFFLLCPVQFMISYMRTSMACTVVSNWLTQWNWSFLNTVQPVNICYHFRIFPLRTLLKLYPPSWLQFTPSFLFSHSQLIWRRYIWILFSLLRSAVSRYNFG